MLKVFSRLSRPTGEYKQRNCFLDLNRAQQEVTDAACNAEELPELLGSDKRKGIRCVTKGQQSAELREKRQMRVREDRIEIVNECLKGITVQELQSSRPPLHTVKNIRPLALTWLLFLAHNSSATRHHRRSRDKLSRSYTSRHARLVTLDLPRAVDASEGSFLQKGLTFPPRGPQSRAREFTRGWERGSHQQQAKIATNYAQGKAPSQLYPHISVFVDKCPTKGQKTTSTFAFAGILKKLHCSRGRLAKRVSIQIVNGSRTSKQAAGLQTFLSHNQQRVNHRRIKPTDLPQSWDGPMVSQFHHLVCPVTGHIVCRDPPACSNVVIVGICSNVDAPVPFIFTKSTHG